MPPHRTGGDVPRCAIASSSVRGTVNRAAASLPALAQPGEQIDFGDRGGRAVLLADERFDAAHKPAKQMARRSEDPFLPNADTGSATIA
jgi:hypothetical protein